MTLPLVTIGIPTRNRANTYLRDALGSAMRQTYRNVEIVVSDNCSTDDTAAFVEGLHDPRIRYYRHPQDIGANSNFNFCLAQARGDYFLLLHDDDMIDPDFVEACMRAAGGGSGIGIIRTGTRVIDSDGTALYGVPNRVVGLSTEGFFRGWFTGKTAPYLCSTLFNTRALRALGGFGSKHQLFQDMVAEVQLAARFGRVDVEDVKASFRKHPTELTFATSVRDWCEDSRFLLDLMCELVPEGRAAIRSEGLRFFSRLNYRRASAVQPRLRRLMAYLVVFRAFGYRYLPPAGDFYGFMRGTAAHALLRRVKRSLLPRPVTGLQGRKRSGS